MIVVPALRPVTMPELTLLTAAMLGSSLVQIAGVPHRHEPDQGEVDYPYLFALLDELGYDGWIGCEYRPRAGTSAGLDWLRRARLR